MADLTPTKPHAPPRAGLNDPFKDHPELKMEIRQQQIEMELKKACIDPKISPALKKTFCQP